MGQLTSPLSRLTGKMVYILLHYFEFNNGWRRLHIGRLLRLTYLRYHIIYCCIAKCNRTILQGDEVFTPHMLRQVRKLLFRRVISYILRKRVSLYLL